MRTGTTLTLDDADRRRVKAIAAPDSDEADHPSRSEAGHSFRSEVGRSSDLKPAAVPIRCRPPRRHASGREDHPGAVDAGQAGGGFRARLRRLSPPSSMR